MTPGQMERVQRLAVRVEDWLALEAHAVRVGDFSMAARCADAAEHWAVEAVAVARWPVDALVLVRAAF